MANRWGNIGNSDGLYFGGSQITVYGDCNHEIKRCLLLGRKFLTNLKSRDITLPTKVHLVKALVFPVVIYGCELDCKESWAPKNWCFWTIVLEKTLENPWTARRSNHSILKEICSGYLLEALVLKAKLQYFGYLMWRSDSFGKTLMLGKIKGRKRRGWERIRWKIRWHHWLDGHESEQVPGVVEGQESLVCCSPWGCKESDMIEWLKWCL